MEILWGKEAQGSKGRFRRRRKQTDADFAPTRRMPSDAVAALWLDELEGLE